MQQYSAKEYEFLGKQVAAGRYVTRTTCVLALLLALLTGLCMGRYLFPDTGNQTTGAGQKRPLGEASELTAAVNPDRQLFDSILQHEEDARRTPDNPEVWEHLGNLYFDAKEPAKAVRAYERSLELAPGNTSVLVDCGVMYRSLGDYDKALELFRKALALDPRHEHALFNSGIVLYHDLGRKEEALDRWRALVQINPSAKAPSGMPVSQMIKEHS